MNIDEFKSRTEKFLTADEIKRYDELFEPAYMAASNVNKDDFCKILKDPLVRRFVIDMSIAVVDHHSHLDGITASYKKQLDAADARYKAVQGYRQEEAAESAKFRKALLLIAATCDRAGVTAGDAD